MNQRTEILKLKKEIVRVRKTLKEVNLLNAKFLYTNRLFNLYNLPQEKKQEIIESFDKDKTVEEVKHTYCIFDESIKTNDPGVKLNIDGVEVIFFKSGEISIREPKLRKLSLESKRSIAKKAFSYWVNEFSL